MPLLATGGGWLNRWLRTLRGGGVDDPTTTTPTTLIFVDPLDDFGASTTVRETCAVQGLRVVNMWSPQVAQKILDHAAAHDGASPLAHVDVDDVVAGTAPPLDTPEDVATWLDRRGVVGGAAAVLGVVCESDVGLRTAETAAALLDLPTANAVNEARRDKYLMQEAVAAELARRAEAARPPSDVGPLGRPIRQVLTDTWPVAEAFLRALPSFDAATGAVDCVIKPCRGSASLGVFRAASLAGAQKVPSLSSYVGYPAPLSFSLLTPFCACVRWQVFEESLGRYGSGWANGTASAALLVQVIPTLPPPCICLLSVCPQYDLTTLHVFWSWRGVARWCAAWAGSGQRP
jgi:hypothetical protein